MYCRLLCRSTRVVFVIFTIFTDLEQSSLNEKMGMILNKQLKIDQPTNPFLSPPHLYSPSSPKMLNSVEVGQVREQHTEASSSEQ